MMSAKVQDDGGIPDFLKVANRGKIKPPGVKKGRKAVLVEEAPPPPADPLAHLEDGETKDFIRDEIRTGRFRAHWFESDITPYLLVRHSLKSKADARAEQAALKKAEKETVKALKPPFGVGIRIVIVVEEPKRKPGSARIASWADMKGYIKKNPNASVSEVIEKTSYKKADYDRDLRLKLIKTDLVKSDVKPEPVKIDVAKIAAKKKGKKK